MSKPAFTVTRWALTTTYAGGHDVTVDVTLHTTEEDALLAAEFDEQETERLRVDLFVDREDGYTALQRLEVGVSLLEAAEGLGDPELLA